VGHVSAPLSGAPRDVRNRIGGVESLRAIAAISVLGFHAVFASGLAESGAWIEPFASRLEVGVSIFFLISGFLLYRPWARAHLEGGESPQLSWYAASRLLRIVPAYWVALAVIAIWIGLESVLDAPGFLIYFGFLQNYDPDTVGGGLLQAWSLGVEAAYYAFLPLFAVAVARLSAANPADRLRNQWLGLGTLFAAGIAYNAGVAGTVENADNTTASVLALLPAYLDQFALGMAFGLLTITGQGRVGRFPTGLSGVGAAAWLLAGAVAFVVASKGIGLEGGYESVTGVQLFLKHNLFSVIALSLLVVAVLAGGRIGALFELRPLRWLGLVSYGIFLWHIAVLTQMGDSGFSTPFGGSVNWLVWAGVALMGTTVFAALSWYLIERPALDARSRVAAAFRMGWRRRTEPAP
jgi:peptidoglycan/LPS O-acetylase OafA/YrhL